MKYKIKDSQNLNANGLCELQRRKSAHETRNSSKVASYSKASLDLQTAQQRFQLQVPDEFKCPSDNGLTETMNSASLRYVTNFSNSVFMTIAQRQTKTIKLQLTEALRKSGNRAKLSRGVFGALVNWLQRTINGQRITMNQNMAMARFAMLRNQRSLEQRMYAIVREHRRHMPIASVDVDPVNNQVSICKYGYVAEHVVKKVPWSFVHYNMYLSRVIAQQRLSLNKLNEDIRKKHLDNGDKVKPSNLHRIPRLFQVIPQLLPKLRFMTVGITTLAKFHF
jgi:hypothetical protein